MWARGSITGYEHPELLSDFPRPLLERFVEYSLRNHFVRWHESCFINGTLVIFIRRASKSETFILPSIKQSTECYNKINYLECWMQQCGGRTEDWKRKIGIWVPSLAQACFINWGELWNLSSPKFFHTRMCCNESYLMRLYCELNKFSVWKCAT